MKTVLVRPNANKQYPNLNRIRGIEPPIWHAIMADYYKAERIVDAEALNLDTYSTVDEILKYPVDKVIILTTGSHPSAFIQQQAEAERIKNMMLGFRVVIINKLPVSPVKWKARWDLLPNKTYRAHNWHSWSNNCQTKPYGALYTSISCPFNCNFCTIKDFYGSTYEQRTLEAVKADLDYFADNNVKNIKIMDELFIFNTERVNSICQYIIDKKYDFNIWAYARIDIMNLPLLNKLKEAGVNWLAYGIETGNDEIRKSTLKGKFDNNKIREVVKMTKGFGINVLGNFMFGFWEDNIDTMKETLDFALELECEYANLYCVVAYPDSPLYKDMKDKGVDLPTSWEEYAQFSNKFKPLPTKYVTGKEVLEFRDSAFNTIFSDNNYLKMMKNKFSNKVISDILNMRRIKIRC